MPEISLSTQTMFADLLQRTLDAEFDDKYDERGLFKRRKRGKRYYWYFKEPGRGGAERYVGPVTDTVITDRVKRFAELGSDFRDRQSMVRGLIAAGLNAPDNLSGRVVEAMWKAGFFRLRGVLVGTAAFQAYGGLLGISLRGRASQTQDADFAQFWGISENIGETMPPILDVISEVDDTFAPIASIKDPFISARYRNSAGYYVDTLTPNRGSDEHQAKLARMKAMSNSPAQPLRHLDYLIFEPERSVLLHGGGVPVTVPRAERFAIHKLIVSSARSERAKSPKDALQAGILIEALQRQRPLELAEALVDAWNVGPKWRQHLEDGAQRLTEDQSASLQDVLDRWQKSRRAKSKELAEPLPEF